MTRSTNTTSHHLPTAAESSVQTITNHVDGQRAEPHTNAWLENIEPATGRVYSRLPDSDERDVARAVESARRAFAQWSTTPAKQRSDVLLRLADLIDDHLDQLARAESIDTGKPIALARSVDIPRASSNLRFFATAILHTNSEAHFTDEQAINYTLRQPLGVVGLISPWNLPLYLFTWKIAPAIATGNTAVAKPSELTPMTAFMLGELAQQAGLPEGVLNIVHGTGAQVGDAIVRHPDIKAISFTGSTQTGAQIASTAGPMFKKLSLEMGGKNPNIVFDDADLERALPMSVRAAFANQGQICLCGSRLFVHRALYDPFVKRFVEQTKQLRSGDPLEENTQQGAVVSRQHLQKIQSYIDLATREGGTIQCGGSRPSALPDRCKDGYFLEPTVITDLDVNSQTNKDEIFGPVVAIMPFDDEQQVIEYANSVRYGLSASIWTQHLDRAHRVAAQIDAGTVWVNCWLLRDLRVPFGGMKDSGVGREGGNEALRFFTEPKNVCVRVRDEK